MNARDYLQEIDEFEAHYQYDSTYMRELLANSKEGYRKFDNIMPLVSHREFLDTNTFWLAKLATMQVEDCGHCLQLNVRMALEDKVSKSLISAVLNGGNELTGNLRDVYEYSTNVAAQKPVESDLQNRINKILSKGALLELGLCIATAKLFPTIKRTLGYTKQCSLVEIAM